MTRDLETLALEHHRTGGRWADFWAMHADAMRQAVPSYDRAGFHKLYSRLLSLVVSGDLDGCRAVGDEEPWLADEAKADSKSSCIDSNPQGMSGRSGRSVAGAVAD